MRSSGYLLLALSAGAPAATPGAHWSAMPTQSQACRAGLAQAQDYLKTLATTSMLAVRNGEVLASHGPVEQANQVYSVRKSILAMMYGPYVADGTIALDRSLASLDIDDIGGLLPLERTATVGDLLAARSGVYHAAANPGDDADAAPPRGSQTPGAYFLYNNWDFNAAGTVYEQLTRRDIYQSFASDLARPLQMEDFRLSQQHRTGDPARSRHLAYHFHLSTRDMARLGQLMLQRGSWNGRQLLPADWLARIATPITRAADMHPPSTARRRLDYGLLWWIPSLPAGSPLTGSYMAWGYYGQYILVVPSQNMVISHQRVVDAAAAKTARKVTSAEFLHLAELLVRAPCVSANPMPATPSGQQHE
ncbi:class C beta-lactamase-related serine hydrolase [Duganella sp. BJB488]|uniref:serine hydrolase domain-containing protein n=1 Tax=unclassified Duganella TaxID=2636909 RepID=UPI000E34CC91|nr:MULTISPECIES: serine hydrolase [unclassified Duganella]RFP17718.1 class C beta-lactamase-related serine hydrolase [Duganella sp. BJB489]RFP22227.1 class C beta-lactamase-related serine hydrolase [Duganella sp. BJB488]RFP37560.1 class C beta-lactamase-related serine hydrolase [Duganella sp. BJB480]